MKALPVSLPNFPLRKPLIWLIAIWTLCVLQSLLVASRAPWLALALPAAVIAGRLLWVHMGYIPALIVGSAFLVPFELDIGTTSRLNAVIILTSIAVGVLLVRVVLEGKLWTLANRVTLPLYGLAVTGLVSFCAGLFRTSGSSQFASAPLRGQVAGLALFLLSIGAMLLALHPEVSEHHRRVLTVVFLLLGGLFLLRFVVPGVSSATDAVVPQETVKGVFRTWLVVLALGQCFWNRDLSRYWRLACGGIVVVSLWSSLTFNLAWATGWLPPLVGVMAVIWISSPRWGVVLTVAALLLAGLYWEDLLALIMVGDQSYSLLTRWEALKIVSDLVLRYPLLGLGMANYYYEVAFSPILGWFVPFSSHNNYVDIAAQTGLLGLLFLFWFSLEFLRMIWRARHRIGSGFSRAFLFACWGGWIGCLSAAALADWLIPFVYNVGVAGFRASVLSWLFAGAAIATAGSLQEPSPHPKEEKPSRAAARGI